MRISGSQYVTANGFFSEIFDLHCMLTDMQSSSDISVMNMGFNMRVKFDKYWGDLEKMNCLIFIGTIMDPRYKLEFLEFSVNQLYGTSLGSRLLSIIKSDMILLFEDYVCVYGSSSASESGVSQASHSVSETEFASY